MSWCGIKACDGCSCWRQFVSFQASSVSANVNSAPKVRPKKIVRRNPREAAMRLEERFRESMQSWPDDLP